MTTGIRELLKQMYLGPLDIDPKHLDPNKNYCWKDNISMDWSPVPADTHPYFIQDCHKIVGNIITFTHNRPNSARLYLCWRPRQAALPDISTTEQLAEVSRNHFMAMSEFGVEPLVVYIGDEDPRGRSLKDLLKEE